MRAHDPVAVRFQLLDLLAGFLRTQALHTAARLGIADIVGEDPTPVEVIAERVGADPSALRRVMRLLASSGVFSEPTPGAFVGTALSDGLREDHPASVRYMAMLQGSDTYTAAAEMLRSVKTGKPAAETVFGMPFFEHLEHHPEHGDVFNRAMAGSAAARAATALKHDWSSASIVADIGGGDGSMLSTVLAAQPHLRGVVFDLPHVIDAARPMLESTGLNGRCDAVGGDFFTDPFPPADVYVLAQILHDWDDERSVAILRNCRRSIAPDGSLLVLEQVLAAGDEPSYAKVLDLIMLLMLGGKERTEAEWRTLLERGGFELRAITAGPAASLIEAVPVSLRSER
jgi:SAM-dependent methyltransferase